jgi:hypothetical protein
MDCFVASLLAMTDAARWELWVGKAKRAHH